MRFGLLLLLFSAVLCQEHDPAGVYFRLNQKGLDYVAELAAQIFPGIINGIQSTEIDTELAVIRSLHISNVTKPKITAKFVEKRGVSATIEIPSLFATAIISLFLLLNDTLALNISNFRIDLDLDFIYNGTISVNASKCEITKDRLGFQFPPNSGLESFREPIIDGATSALSDALCKTSVEALQFIVNQKPIQPDEEGYVTSSPSDPKDFSAGELGYSICKTPKVVELEETDALETVEETNSTSNIGTFGADLSVKYPPTFTKDDMMIGLDGGIIYNGWKAKTVKAPKIFNKTHLDKRMVGILLSEYVPNTLFEHIFVNQIGSFTKSFGYASLPRFLQKLAKMSCSKCFIEVSANLTERPQMEIDAVLGARIELAGNVSAKFYGKNSVYDLIQAYTKFQITLKPTIRHSQIFGDISLTNVDVNVFDVGVSGPMAAPIEKLFSLVVPKILWPQVKKRLRFALNRRGIKLPVLCGVEFEHLTLDFVDHAAVLNTDFKFDVPMFVQTFRGYMNYKSLTNPNLPRYKD